MSAGFSKKQRQAVWEKTDGHCWYCGIAMQRTNTYSATDEFNIDHLTSWRYGGTHQLSNLVPACRECNSRKKAKSLEEYRAWLARRGLPHFTAEHIAYLEKLQIPVPLGFPCYPEIIFWGEEHARAQEGEG